MIDPKKKLRQVLHSLYPLSYRIKQVEPSKEIMTKKIFIETIHELRKIEDRTDFLQSEIGMDVGAYENSFFLVIENLMKLAFNKEQLALIQLYLYQLIPDKDWDGTITIEKEKQEAIVNFKTPEDVWNVIKKFE
jgi:hypothetical protein